MRASELIDLIFDKMKDKVKVKDEKPGNSKLLFHFARRMAHSAIETYGDIEIDVRRVPPKESEDRDPS